MKETMKVNENTHFQSARRHKAICGLIEGRSLQEIADECEISTRTLQRWMDCPQFIQEYEKAHQKFLERVDAKLQAAADLAAAKIVQLMHCGIPSVEMTAAKTILRSTERAKEIKELRKLIQELKQATASQSKQIARLQKSSDELEDLKTQFKTCTLGQPKWMTDANWNKLRESDPFREEIGIVYVDDHPSALRYPHDEEAEYDAHTKSHRR